MEISASFTEARVSQSIMPWRIHDSVTHGEIDNREKGLVCGRIWLHGAAEPTELMLKGNACPDLAGCLLKFRNPDKTISLSESPGLNPRQHGLIGDLTASRKVRVPNLPAEEFYALKAAGKPAPEHTANALYLEWFSDENGRVVIEAVGWELEISPPEWRLSQAEEEQRARDAAAGMSRFLERLTEEIDKHKIEDHERKWDEHDYEKFFRECDARGEKYSELLEKYGDSPGAAEKIDEAMGWTGGDPDEEEDENEEDDGVFTEEFEHFSDPDDLSEPQPDPAREGIDWIRIENGEIRHPLQHRCHQSVVRFWDLLERLDPPVLEAHESVRQFLFDFQAAGAKLRGALDSIADGSYTPEPGFTVAYLKRGLNYIHLSQAGLEAAASQNVLPSTLTAEARAELFAIRQGIIDLMEYYRQQE